MMKKLLIVYISVIAVAFTAMAGDLSVIPNDALPSRPVGMIHLPRCSNAQLLLDLAERFKTAQIHAQHPDIAKVIEMRKAIDATGLLNRRISVDQGDLNRLLPIGNSCDWILITDLSNEDLTPRFAEEVAHVLHPWYGSALLIGNASKAMLTNWVKLLPISTHNIKSTFLTETSLSANNSSQILRIDKGELINSDNWPLWWHDPGNSAVSHDTAYAMDETFQWTGRPFVSPREELPIINNGRLFMLWNSLKMGKHFVKDFKLADLAGEGAILTAQATGSGQRLWAHRLSPASWSQTARSVMAADGERLLVADGGNLLVFDAANGQVLQSIASGSDEIRWISIIENRILLLGGPKSEALGMKGLMKQVIPFRSGGQNLMALDRKTFDVAWQQKRQPGPEAFDPRSAAADTGRVFFMTENGQAEALSLVDGKNLWKTSTNLNRAKPTKLDWDFTGWNPVSGFALEGVYTYSATEVKEGYVFDQKTGKLLWTSPAKKGSPFIPLLINGKFHRIDRGSAQVFDPRTGEASASTLALSDTWCARVTATPNGIFTNDGQRRNLITGEAPMTGWHAKSSCVSGSFVANGLLWKVPQSCQGCSQWLGLLVRGQAEQRPQPTARLLKGGDSKLKASILEGWSTYRGNSARSGFSPAQVSDRAKILWQAPPLFDPGPQSIPLVSSLDLEIVPTPPVVSGNIIIVGGGDGSVEAFDLATGKRKWRSSTGGRIYSSPTIWRDRVFAGSADGCLYCFALADGQELWQLRVAPNAGRMMLYGQNASRWPVLCSPLVTDNQVIVTAGMVNGVDAIWAVAADPVNGNILWEQNNWKALDPYGQLSGAGQLCLQEQSIAFHGGAAPLAYFNIETGAARPAWRTPTQDVLKKQRGPSEFYATKYLQMYLKGQEVGSLDMDWLVCGGSIVFMDQTWPGNQRTAITFVNSSDPQGLPLVRSLDCTYMPAWDDRDLIAVTAKNSKTASMVLISQKVLRERLDKAFDGNSINTRTMPTQLLGGIELDDDTLYTWKQTTPTLKIDNRDVYGCILSSNKVLLLSSGSPVPALSAYDRKTGKDLWTVELPSIPLRRGFAVAPNGTIIVCMKDGSLICIGG